MKFLRYAFGRIVNRFSSPVTWRYQKWIVQMSDFYRWHHIGGIGKIPENEFYFTFWDNWLTPTAIGYEINCNGRDDGIDEGKLKYKNMHVSVYNAMSMTLLTSWHRVWRDIWSHRRRYMLYHLWRNINDEFFFLNFWCFYLFIVTPLKNVINISSNFALN